MDFFFITYHFSFILVSFNGHTTAFWPPFYKLNKSGILVRLNVCVKNLTS